MKQPLKSSDRTKLRRIALNQQGLLKADTFGRGPAGALNAIEHIGYVQIDTISVVERAHHHVFRSRVANYEPAHLDQLVAERKVFEYWSHAASWLPMRDYRFALPRMQAIRSGDIEWMSEPNQKLQKQILKRIREEGPLMSKDFKDTRKGSRGWWDWKPAKRELDRLFMQGDLMVSHRNGFQKVYDLPERVLPEDLNTTLPPTNELASHLIETQLRAHGSVTYAMITYLRKGNALRAAVREELRARTDAGELSKWQLKGNKLLYVSNERLESKTPPARPQVRILSPFDNAVIHRDRVSTLFDFNYQIECYVPEAKRQYGYFCLPILYRDRLVGRLDCKAHRKEQTLEIKSAHIERAVDETFPTAMQTALQNFLRFNQCDTLIGEQPW